MRHTRLRGGKRERRTASPAFRREWATSPNLAKLTWLLSSQEPNSPQLRRRPVRACDLGTISVPGSGRVRGRRSLKGGRGKANEKSGDRGGTHIRTFPLSLDASLPSSLPSPRPPTCRRQLPPHHFRRHSPPMIAVQKPPSLFSSPAFRPIHARHPSAPVVVRPSHTPGVLNLSKPAQPSPRPQHVQPQPRAPRASPKNKPQQRSPQPSHAQAAAPEKTKSPASSPAKADQPPSTTDKSPRGRKQNKQTKDAGRRLAPPSTHVWRPAHR